MDPASTSTGDESLATSHVWRARCTFTQKVIVSLAKPVVVSAFAVLVAAIVAELLQREPSFEDPPYVMRAAVSVPKMVREPERLPEPKVEAKPKAKPEVKVEAPVELAVPKIRSDLPAFMQREAPPPPESADCRTTDEPAGFATLASIPYSDVYIGDRKIGETPVSRHKLRAGCNRVRFVTRDGRSREEKLIIESNKVSIFTVRF